MKNPKFPIIIKVINKCKKPNLILRSQVTRAKKKYIIKGIKSPDEEFNPITHFQYAILPRIVLETF